MASTSSAKTMPAFSQHTQAALLKSVNRVFNLEREADSIEELTDGVALAHVLHELDPEFEPLLLEYNQGSSKYLANKRNMQAIYKGLFRFIRRQVPELGCQAKKFDYHAVAENPDPRGICQLLAVMIAAAAMGPDNGKFVPRIQCGLDRDEQAEIMQIIRVMQQDASNFRDEDDVDEAIDAVMEARDIDLVVEEQNAALRQQLESTKKSLSDYITRLDHLQQSHEELKYAKETNDRELEVLRKATQDGVNSAEAIKLLEAQVREQMEIIARNEEAIRRHDRIKAQLESEVQKLSQKSEEADELRDQASEWKHRAEELEKKANTAERYKQKLESQQNLVKELQNLEYEKADLQEQLRSLVSEQERGSRTRKAEDELRKMITQSEQHLWDERNQKNQLLRDNTGLEEDLARLKAQKINDERLIRDLQEQLQQSGSGAPEKCELDTALGSYSLEDELSVAVKEESHSAANINLELSRLRAENELLRQNLDSTGDFAPLRQEADDLRRQRDRLQIDFNEMFEKSCVTQEQLNSLIANSVDEGSRSFISLMKRLSQSQSDLQNSLKRVTESNSTIADLRLELTNARAQQVAATEGGKEAIDKLQSTDTLVARALKRELDQLRENLNYSIYEREAQKSQLIDALLAKDKLRKEIEDSKCSQDENASRSINTDTSEVARKSENMVEKLRARLRERKQQLEDLDHQRSALQMKLNAVQEANDEKLFINLQRENALIVAAWYDLTSRIQSNHVILQRRQDAPSSWLNKQRQMVHGSR